MDSGLPVDSAPGTGTRGMHERASLIGASLEIRNVPEGGGCEVRLDVPLKEPQ